MMIFFGVACVSICVLSLFPLLSMRAQNIISYGVAIIFWIGMIAGCICLIRLELLRKELKGNKKKRRWRPPGIVAFSVDKPHMALYGGIFLGLTLIVSDLVEHWISSYIMYPIIAATLFLFIIHCIIDGKNYRTYKFLKEGANDGMACKCKED